METLRGMGHDTATLWEAIGQLVTKTLVSVQPHLEHTYYTCRQRSDDAGFGCFEVLHPLSYLHPLTCHPRPWLGVGVPGFDVIFDHQPQPRPRPKPSPQPQPSRQPQPSPNPNQVLGFDVMFDHQLRPFLIEVNHSPSFTCDSPLDTTVKSAVLKATMEMVSFCKTELSTLKRAGTRLDPKVTLHCLRTASAPPPHHLRAASAPPPCRLRTNSATPPRRLLQVLARLTHLRREYEKEASQSCGYQRIYPLEADDCGGDADRAAEQMELYASYLDIAVRHAYALYLTLTPHPSPLTPHPSPLTPCPRPPRLARASMTTSNIARR